MKGQDAVPEHVESVFMNYWIIGGLPKEILGHCDDRSRIGHGGHNER